MNAQTEMTEAQRQFDNKLLRLIQQHFPSIPLHGEEADKNWTRWLNFARDCAHLTKPDAGGGEVQHNADLREACRCACEIAYPGELQRKCSVCGDVVPSKPVPAEPSVVPMPAYIYGRECSENERVLPIAAVEHYADARVAEAIEACAKACDTRKAQSRNHLVRSALTVAAADIRALIAKYTQTQEKGSAAL